MLRAVGASNFEVQAPPYRYHFCYEKRSMSKQAKIGFAQLRSQVPPDQPQTRSGGKDAVNAALEIFNRRWCLRILWELRKTTLTFRALQAACGGVSPSVLNERLAELRAALLVQHDPSFGYELTEHGRKLMIAARPLLRWAPEWADALRRAQ